MFPSPRNFLHPVRGNFPVLRGGESSERSCGVSSALFTQGQTYLSARVSPAWKFVPNAEFDCYLSIQSRDEPTGTSATYSSTGTFPCLQFHEGFVFIYSSTYTTRALRFSPPPSLSVSLEHYSPLALTPAYTQYAFFSVARRTLYLSLSRYREQYT